MDINIVNIKSASVRWCFYVLSNTYAAFEAQYKKKLTKTEAVLKKSVADKKAYISISTKNPQLIPPPCW